MRVRLVVEYDGAEFHGFQRQPGLRTVDQVLEEAIFRLTGEKARVTGSGRTDAGVHALGQVAAFDTERTIPAPKYAPALNTFLPADIKVIESAEAPAGFHPRYQAVSKTYRYLVFREAEGYTFYRRYAFQFTRPLDPALMRKAAGCVVGERDFRGFMSAGSAVADTVRNVTQFDVEEARPWMRFEITANGFLYHMVRNLAGTLIEIGRGAMSLEDLAAVLMTGDRTRAGPTAPAQGLYLVRVDY